MVHATSSEGFSIHILEVSLGELLKIFCLKWGGTRSKVSALQDHGSSFNAAQSQTGREGFRVGFTMTLSSGHVMLSGVMQVPFVGNAF